MALRVLLPLILMSATGCSLNYVGERAETGECPPGEVCSLITPNGLHFYGAEFADRSWLSFNDLPPTAVGGSQTITVYKAGYHQPFDFPFTATMTGEQLVILLTSTGQVELYGAQGGSALLRLTDYSNRLFDRIWVTAERITQAALGPANEELGSDEDTWALYPGATARVVGKLFGSLHNRLVDETMQIYPRDASTLVSAYQDSWDTLLFETTADATEVDVVIHSGDGDEHVEMVLFQNWIDAVNPLFGDVPQALHEYSRWVPICFEARAGGTRVFGVPWEIGVTGDATILTEPHKANCAQIFTGQAGDLGLSVEVLGITLNYPITVLPANQP